MIFFDIIFVLSSFCLIYSYILYPILLNILSDIALYKNIYSVNNQYNIIHKLINIIIPVHNEEKVIRQKLESIAEQNYPKEKIKIYIGLDNCSDNSINEILKFNNQLNIKILESKKRIGKSQILNLLFEQIQDEEAIVVITDVDIIFTTNTLIDILYSFDNKFNILTDLKLKNNDKEAIEENLYLNLENSIKTSEAKLFNIFQGVSGACYAIKRKYFSPVPDKFLVDDFFISMQAMLQYPRATFLENSFVYEFRPKNLQQEFERKARIAAGNFQNLFYFGSKLLNPFSAIGFTFISHKLFRWLTPFFLLYITAYLLINYTFVILGLTLLLSIFILILSIFDSKKIVKIPFYFLTMQIAVLVGFFRFLKGIKTNIWQPTNRN